MDFQQAAEDIQAFLLEAGAFALSIQKGVKSLDKAGGDALTEADLGVSKMAQQILAPWLSQPGHVLIDEESITKTPTEVFASSEYQWVLDPIDGTAGYALGRYMWAISLGLLHNGKSVVGGFYLPRIGELLLADTQGAWRINPTTQEKIRLTATPKTINSQMFVESYFGDDLKWGRDFTGKQIWMNTPESAVQGFFSALTGQAAAATVVTGYSLWDAAAASAIAEKAGFSILSMDDAQPFQAFTVDALKPNWKLASNWLISHPDNYEAIAKALKNQV